jgi:hypothetical protein
VEAIEDWVNAGAYNKLTVDSASFLEVLIGRAEDIPMDMDITAVAECDGQI